MTSESSGLAVHGPARGRGRLKVGAARYGWFIGPSVLVILSDGWVYVADRESHRVQVFDANGKYETQWSATAWPQLKPDVPVPVPLHSLRKMTRLAVA